MQIKKNCVKIEDLSQNLEFVSKFKICFKIQNYYLKIKFESKSKIRLEIKNLKVKMWFRIFGQNVTSNWYQDVTFNCSKILFSKKILVSFFTLFAKSFILELEAMGLISLVLFYFNFDYLKPDPLCSYGASRYLFTESFFIYNFSTDLFHLAAPPWNPRVPSGPLNKF